MTAQSVECKIKGVPCTEELCLRTANTLEAYGGESVIENSGCAMLSLIHLQPAKHDRPIETFAKKLLQRDLGIDSVKIQFAQDGEDANA